jgi:hypothetical protein
MALWLAEGLETGHSKAHPRSTTYNSPQLSAREEFAIRHVEVGPAATTPTTTTTAAATAEAHGRLRRKAFADVYARACRCGAC